MEQKLDRAPCGYLVLDQGLRIVEMNKTLRTITGVENPKHMHDLLTVASRVYFHTYFTPSIMMYGTVNEMFLTLKSKTGPMPVLMNTTEHDGFYECALIQMSVRGEYEKKLLLAKRKAEDINRETAEAYGKLQILMAEVECKQLELMDLNLELQHLAITDQLTGLKNRRYLEKHLDKLLSKAGNGQGFALLVLDIDHFKQVNDTYGHQMGDAVLQELARRLEAEVGAGDVVVRLGGEEFVVIMPDAGAEEGQVLGNALCSRLASAVWEHVPITVSIGVTAYVTGDKVESLLSRADGFLYKAKANGRNCVIGY